MVRGMPDLRPYQRVGVEHLRRNPRAALLYDMGLGKTATVLRALTPDHLPALVVAPKRVAEEVWAPEADLWAPGLRVGIAAGPPAKRAAALRSGLDLVTLGRDNLADAVPLAQRGTWRTLIIDESSGFKSHASKRFKMAKAMTYPDKPRQPRYVWELTGTPTPNSYLDLWSQIYLLDRGQRLYDGITKYRTRYFAAQHPLPNGVVPGWDIRPGASERIQELISDICLSETTESAGVDLPPVTINRVDVPLPPAARAAYRQLERYFVANVDLLGGGQAMLSPANAAVLSGKLSQVSAGAVYRDPAMVAAHPLEPSYDVVHREKVQAVQEIVAGTGSPVIVFYRYKAEAIMIRDAMPDLVHSPDEPDWYARWNRGEIPVLLTHSASIGHGLNLQAGGHTAVWTTPDWNLELWDQGNKRLHRSGQASSVMVHVLCASKIDRLVLERLAEKKTVQEVLMHYLESPM